MDKFQILFSIESLNNISNHLNLSYISNSSKKDYFYSNQQMKKLYLKDCIDFLYNSLLSNKKFFCLIKSLLKRIVNIVQII